ncbi:ABC transporter substrate-binding protein [Streptomyces sp. PTM05]|uniref:ABC transporter substrate-binding protein n=1 Tax=Streptantibioticus parmotrematis TaxID=2873249 RepID=A0ABS7QT68_9ACTN|nr:ABC transporter substrate-binding protein [Streptantibioticus parmotrematis]MBY8886128.1 ABC transporter substrate-binding protein [Streptantibioticus parmotrematis]
MARIRVPFRHLVALTAGLLLLTGCGSSGGAKTTGSDKASGPAVVATSTWEAALAKAAGATDVTYIVPASIRHAPDYDLKPTDLTKVTGADYVLYTSFEPFAGRVKDAAGSKAKMIELNLDNSPSVTTADVTQLGRAFGTERQAAAWNASFAQEWNTLTRQVKAAWPHGGQPAVVSEEFSTWAAKLAGARQVGTYGPDAVTPQQLRTLSAKKPQFVLDNENMSTGTVLPGSGAEQLEIVNYPGADLNLLGVYERAAEQMKKAFATS